ncbi:DNA repair protein RAD51 homolog 4 isoform X2 [Varanus komodoensis]|uniref:DNA repair protein RAD51 homolog 4 isoform X2 n=1 Tax=Varanus komodoensis TaxID=61221 RepID=UPI001CF7E9B6|nr:DNA repair protein RAD51 homolog 4 isoform X2 [Varanus komodoensis]
MRLRAGLCPGLSAEAVRLLRASGVRTVVDLVSSDLEETARKCSLSYKALVAIRRVLLAQFSAFPVSGADLYEELKTTTAILSTGIQSLDKLLDSGLYTGELTELVGAPGTGKTQVCLSIAACAAQFLKQSVLYVDSTGGVTAARLLQLLELKTEDKQEQAEALQRIQVVRVFDAYRLLDVLQEYRISVAQQITCASPPAKVVLVDSIAAVVCPLLGRRQPDGMALMMQVAWELKAIARECGVAVVLTNHVTRDTSNGSLKPALGRSWSFVPSTRVLLKDSKDSSGKVTAGRIASLVKSPRQS